MSSFSKPINLFLASADALFGPITTVRTSGRITKKIPWNAFRLSDLDWERVKDVRDILTARYLCSPPISVTCSHVDARIPRTFNIISHPNDSQHCGVHSPRLKSCKRHGSPNGTTLISSNTGRRSPMAWESFRNTTLASTGSPVTFLPWVSTKLL
jgi:hypothetical protein